MASETVAFIGLGLMGRPMALHLIKAGYHVRAYNRTAAKAQPLADAGATVCTTPAEAAKDAHVVCTCVGDGPDVRQVILGNKGVIHEAAPNTLIVDHSTISPLIARRSRRNSGLRPCVSSMRLSVAAKRAPLTGSFPLCAAATRRTSKLRNP